VADEAQSAWIERVLGIRLPDPGAVSLRERAKLAPLWQQAKDTVDAQVARLEVAMRKCGLPLAATIADHGLIGAFGGEYVALTVGLLEVDRADTATRPATVQRVAKSVQRMRQTLNGSATLAMLEANPLGVIVLARPMLGAALARIEAALAD
jgi:hypothetical protein